MGQPAVVAKKCILKVNILCRECERRVTLALRKVDGVYSVVVDGDSGKATIIGNMDPFKLIKVLKKKGKTAEILQYMDALPEPPLPPPPPPTTPTGSHQASTDQHHVISQFAHLQNLSNIDRMKHVELTHSKTLKVTFKDSKKGSSSKSEIVTGDVQSHHQNGGASGGSCSVASGSSGQEPPMTCGEGGGPSKGSCYYRCTSPSSCCCCFPPHHGHHNHHVQQAPNPMAYSYDHGIFSNEHPDGCNMM